MFSQRADMRTLLLNFKNYPEALGEGAVKLALVAEKVAAKTEVEMIVSPQNSTLALVASKVSIPVFSQSVGSESGEKTTGADIPEAALAAKAAGTLLNHSEARKPQAELQLLVPRVRGLGLRVCLCVRSVRESVALSVLGPEYMAVEPPELIGSGIAVSKARPEIVRGTVEGLRRAGYRGRILCGAGIVKGEDVSKAVALGADGVLVSSSVVKARDWEGKIAELALSLG
jgi:triosephosphate isomerase